MVPEARVMMIVGSVRSTHSHCCRCWRAGCADRGCDPSDQNTLAITDRAKVSAAGRRGYGMRRWCDGFPLVKRGRPIHAHRLSRVPQALLKHSRRVISRHIPLAPHDVIYMLAHCGRIYRGLASAEAELISRHKIRPLVNFLQRAECAREHEAADRVAIAICTMGVKLAAAITGRNVDVCEIANACDLNVVWSDYDVRTSDGAVRDQSRSVPALHAPCYFDSLRGLHVVSSRSLNKEVKACTSVFPMTESGPG